jgi:pyruvate dehydrogenase E1 component alpha subunit
MQAGTQLTASDLIAFESEVATIFNAGKIRAPVHLSGGTEDILIGIFKNIQAKDYVFSTWRSHYHALLHGVPREKLMDAICAGRSISLNFPEHNFYSSAIVGGMLPIAVGVGWALKRKESEQRAWVFVGDMAAASGMFHECVQYVAGNNLPVVFMTESNGLSVCTPTNKAWSTETPSVPEPENREISYRYDYALPWPHSGAGVRVEF